MFLSAFQILMQKNFLALAYPLLKRKILKHGALSNQPVRKIFSLLPAQRSSLKKKKWEPHSILSSKYEFSYSIFFAFGHSLMFLDSFKTLLFRVYSYYISGRSFQQEWLWPQLEAEPLHASLTWCVDGERMELLISCGTFPQMFGPFIVHLYTRIGHESWAQVLSTWKCCQGAVGWWVELCCRNFQTSESGGISLENCVFRETPLSCLPGVFAQLQQTWSWYEKGAGSPNVQVCHHTWPFVFTWTFMSTLLCV